MKYYLFLLITSGAFVCMNFEKSVWAGDMMNFYPPANMEMQKINTTPASHADLREQSPTSQDLSYDSSQDYRKFQESRGFKEDLMEDIYPPQ